MIEQEQAFFLVKGFSMWPFLKDGQKVLVKKVAPVEFRRGDLVLYLVADQLVCHRLLRRDKKDGKWLFYCRGDASLGNGDQVCEELVEGKVIAVISGARVVNLETHLQRFWARVILVILAPLLAYLDKIYKKLKKRVN